MFEPFNFTNASTSDLLNHCISSTGKEVRVRVKTARVTLLNLVKEFRNGIGTKGGILYRSRQESVCGNSPFNQDND